MHLCCTCNIYHTTAVLLPGWPFLKSRNCFVTELTEKARVFPKQQWAQTAPPSYPWYFQPPCEVEFQVFLLHSKIDGTRDKNKHIKKKKPPWKTLHVDQEIATMLWQWPQHPSGIAWLKASCDADVTCSWTLLTIRPKAATTSPGLLLAQVEKERGKQTETWTF